MPRNIELVTRNFTSKAPLPSVELAYNSLKLKGIDGSEYVLKKELSEDVDIMIRNIEDLTSLLEEHENNGNHLTHEQKVKIAEAINEARVLTLIDREIDGEKRGIIDTAVGEATSESEGYTNVKVQELNTRIDNLPTLEVVHEVVSNKLGDLPTIEEGEEQQPMSVAMEQNPQKLINPEYFYRFKNMIDNSSFEVFDGATGIPLGWDNGAVSPDASMFGTYSMKLVSGQTAKQIGRYQADVNWLNGAYDTSDVILCFYHKFGGVTVKVYDMENECYLRLTHVLNDMSHDDIDALAITFPYTSNWSRFRDMVVFTPYSNTKKVRVELTCDGSEVYIDAPSLEPYVAGEFPSIYKDGRYSVSAHQLLNPPPSDVDRFTSLEHFSVGNSTADENGNLTYQELLRADGSLAIKREASNPDTNGNYQTIVETFYKGNGTINYIDTYSYTYSNSGAILTRTKSSTEVV